MKEVIERLEKQLTKVLAENNRLLLEVNSLQNLVRSLPETPETSKARAIVGPRRWEDQVMSENKVQPSKEPLYVSSLEKVDQSNGSRRRSYEARRDQSNAGVGKVFPIKLG